MRELDYACSLVTELPHRDKNWFGVWGVLVSYAAIRKYHELRGLKTTQIYDLIILDARSSKCVSLGQN